MTDDRMDQDRSTGGGDRNKTTRVYATEKRIKSEVPNVFRITASEYKKYYRMWPVCDDGGKPCPFIIENETQGAGVIARLLGDRKNFYKGGYLESTYDKVNKKKIFKYEAANPELFNWVNKNGVPATVTNSGWREKKEYAYNIRDRDLDTNEANAQIDWCKENKHTKLIRIPQTAFDSLADVRDNDGPIVDYDVNYTKKGTGLETTHSIKRAGAVVANAVQGGLTDEEKAFESYDLEEETKLSSATYILKKLRKRITDIDAVMGSNFIAELETQSAMEKEEWGLDSVQEDTNADGVAVDTPVTPPVVSATPSVIPTDNAAPIRPVRGAAVNTVSVTMVPCASCKKLVPSDAEVCPECKTQLLAPCDNVECRKLFSTFVKECPHCHQTY